MPRGGWRQRLIPVSASASQEIDANFRRHSSALHSHHNAGHHTSPPPPLPVTAPSELSRLDAAMYALPLAMVAVGLIGCCRRRKLREKSVTPLVAPSPRPAHRLLMPCTKSCPTTNQPHIGRYHIGGSFLADFFCHCLFFSCSIAREAREIRVQVVTCLARAPAILTATLTATLTVTLTASLLAS